MNSKQTLSFAAICLLVSAASALAAQQGEVIKPVAILTTAKVSVTHESEVTIYTVDTTKKGSKEKQYKITGPFKIVTDGTALDTTQNGKPVVRISPNTLPSLSAENNGEGRALTACTLVGGPPAGYRCNGLCQPTEACRLIQDQSNRYCTCVSTKITGVPLGSKNVCGTTSRGIAWMSK